MLHSPLGQRIKLGFRLHWARSYHPLGCTVNQTACPGCNSEWGRISAFPEEACPPLELHPSDMIVEPIQLHQE